MTVTAATSGPDDGERPTAPSGWRRALLGFLIGAAIGAAVALVIPRGLRDETVPTGG